MELQNPSKSFSASSGEYNLKPTVKICQSAEYGRGSKPSSSGHTSENDEFPFHSWWQV
jgi:hypothetical protein